VEVSGTPLPERLQALAGQRIQLVQETPQRVAHRRAEKARERWVEYLSITPLEGSADYLVRMRTR
jgi:tRNA U54 and U55 pseudouridine synthase Pus10